MIRSFRRLSQFPLTVHPHPTVRYACTLPLDASCICSVTLRNVQSPFPHNTQGILMSCSLQPKTMVALLHALEDQLASVSSEGVRLGVSKRPATASLISLTPQLSTPQLSTSSAASVLKSIGSPKPNWSMIAHADTWDKRRPLASLTLSRQPLLGRANTRHPNGKNSKCWNFFHLHQSHQLITDRRVTQTASSFHMQ